jgi:hypothetical protein
MPRVGNHPYGRTVGDFSASSEIYRNDGVDSLALSCLMMTQRYTSLTITVIFYKKWRPILRSITFTYMNL